MKIKVDKNGKRSDNTITCTYTLLRFGIAVNAMEAYVQPQGVCSGTSGQGGVTAFPDSGFGIATATMLNRFSICAALPPP